jgi:hypothetical protein
MQDSEFTCELQARSATVASIFSAALTSGSLDAVNLLTEAMNDPETADSNRIRATTAILQDTRVWSDADIDARITELET